MLLFHYIVDLSSYLDTHPGGDEVLSDWFGDVEMTKWGVSEGTLAAVEQGHTEAAWTKAGSLVVGVVEGWEPWTPDVARKLLNSQ
jgi:hypothetical protein